MTTDHEAAEMGKVGMVERFVDWLTYDPHTALEKASGEIARLRVQVLGQKANREVAEKKVDRLTEKNKALDKLHYERCEQVDRLKVDLDASKDRIASLEGELKQTADKLHSYIQDKQSFGLMAQERDRLVSKNQASEAKIAELKKALDKIRDIIKEQYDLVYEFPDDDEDEDCEDEEFGDGDDDEPYCDICGCPVDECEC